ncbi:hypothetical protein JTB14_023888 [Gonioctena quinquepunctata]|nr:hypothetical protein JTB14_023888 [Gonioctena quinquepunctata]
MTLLEYSLTIKYRAGRDTGNADSLSRIRVPEDEPVSNKQETQAQALGNIDEMPIHSSVEENTPELQIEENNVKLPLMEGLEIDSEVQKTNDTDSAIITEEGLNNETDIESSDSEYDDGIEICDCEHCTMDRHRGMSQPPNPTAESALSPIDLLIPHNTPSNCDCNRRRDIWPLCGCKKCTTAPLTLRDPNQPGPSRAIESRRDLNIPWLPVNGPRRWNCKSPPLSSSSWESDDN